MEINVKKIAAYCVGALVAVWLVLNVFTVVSAGTSKVQTTFGTVNPKHFGEGIHFPVNPFSSFDTFDTRNQRYEIEKLNIPTQDRFNSSGNVTVLYRIEDSKTPYIKQNYGTADEFIDKTMRQHLRSIVRDEGRKVKDSRGLAQSDVMTVLQDSTKKRLSDGLDGTGIDVQDVLIQDIEFDPRIADQILATQQRIQREEAESSQLRIIETQAKQAVAQAEGEAGKRMEQAKADAYAVEAAAKAQALSVREAADAERYQLEQKAVGNKALQASLTGEILKLRELEVRQVEAGKGWDGSVPTTVTVLGEGQQPLFLKNMK